jgi:hypothetical protein
MNFNSMQEQVADQNLHNLQNNFEAFKIGYTETKLLIFPIYEGE